MATDPVQPPRRGATTGVREVVGDVPDSRPYRPGYVIDKKFQLIRRVGEGGMGAVWVAHNRILDVQIGIKLIGLFKNRDDRVALARRLLDEARSAARIGHPAILKIHDFGITEHADPFIAMELLEGEDLGRVLERERRLPANEAIRTLLPIAHGLVAAHEKGVVHRDVKPENVFLAKDDDGTQRPKLVDFGIARIADNPNKNTLEGAALGTPDYLSPELARGEAADPSCDVWSFCVVLYELASGACPFVGSNYNALMQSIIQDPPVPLAERGVDDPELWIILQKGLQKRVEDRFASMRELGQELARLLISRGVAEDITHTSLRSQWLREPSSSDGEASGTATGAPHGSKPDDEEESKLSAIAEMNRGGDPVEVWEREEQRRHVGLAIAAAVIAVSLVFGILIGTGVL